MSFILPTEEDKNDSEKSNELFIRQVDKAIEEAERSLLENDGIDFEEAIAALNKKYGFK
ncbi:MAG: hypothetical protein HUJ58_09695 [Erysipelotrichaceae bacterium]|nr:hypothetical protein [Erysipelotrichaceae bacterium]